MSPEEMRTARDQIEEVCREAGVEVSVVSVRNHTRVQVTLHTLRKEHGDAYGWAMASDLDTAMVAAAEQLRERLSTKVYEQHWLRDRLLYAHCRMLHRLDVVVIELNSWEVG